jgi:hypothetical protein
VLGAYGLDSTDYDQLEEHTELLLNTLQFGGKRRGEELSRGLGAEFYATDQELLEEIRSLSASSQALYRLTKTAAEPLLRDVAEERPEAFIPYLDLLMQDKTASGENMEVVRNVAKRVIQSAVENLPEQQYEELSPYDSQILPLMQNDDKYDVNFALEWARRSGSQAAVDALVAIHKDETDHRWQRATAILEDLAPEKVDPETEPENTHTEWLTFVAELAEESGQLPTSSEVTDHPDSPEIPFWEVFDGWSDVLESLDIPTVNRASNAPLRSNLIADLQRVAEQISGIPTTSDIANHSEYSYHNYKQEFGGIKEARREANLNQE